MMAYNEPYGNDMITPGASTVAKFKTLILVTCKISVRQEQSVK